MLPFHGRRQHRLIPLVRMSSASPCSHRQRSVSPGGHRKLFLLERFANLAQLSTPTPDNIHVVSLDDVRSLLDAPSAAALVTYRADGSADVSPVWYRCTDSAFEVVIAADDQKL